MLPEWLFEKSLGSKLHGTHFSPMPVNAELAVDLGNVGVFSLSWSQALSNQLLTVGTGTPFILSMARRGTHGRGRATRATPYPPPSRGGTSRGCASCRAGVGRGSSLASQPAPTSGASQPTPAPVAPQPTQTPGAPQTTPTPNVPQQIPAPGAPQPTPPPGAPHPSSSQPPAVPPRDMSLDDFIAMIRTIVRQEQSAGSTSASASGGASAAAASAPVFAGLPTALSGPATLPSSTPSHTAAGALPGPSSLVLSSATLPLPVPQPLPMPATTSLLGEGECHLLQGGLFDAFVLCWLHITKWVGALDRSLLCVAGGCVHAIFLFNWLCLVYFVLLFFAPATSL